MLSKITPGYINELHKLVNSAMWPEIKKHLTKEYDTTILRILNTADVAELHEMRGRVKFIKDFLDTASNTQEIIRKFKS